MTTQLIADAVVNQRDGSEVTLWDRLFALWFSRLVYNQIWEDPEADLAALELAPNATIVTISSGGCNALSYLTAQPRQVYAVDLNEAHLNLLKLKLAGLRGFQDYVSFWQFFGAADQSGNRDLYRTVLRPLLDDPARRFWDGRDITGRPRHRYFESGLYRHGTMSRFIGVAHVIARLYRIDLAALLRAPADPERMRQLVRIDRVFQSPLARLLAKTPALLFSLGIPPRQRELLAGDGRLNEILHARLLHLVDGFPTDQNYFAWQALRRRYPGPGNRCLPLYLQERHFGGMCASAGKVVPVHANIRALLDALPARHVDAVVLLDSQDWMAPEEIRMLWNAIDRCGTSDVQVIFRTAGQSSPLEEPHFADLRRRWSRDAIRSARSFQQDRSAIYGGFHLYRRG